MMQKPADIDSPSGKYRKRPQDRIMEVQKLAVAEKVFWVALCWFQDYVNLWSWNYVKQSSMDPTSSGGAPGVLVALPQLPQSPTEAPRVPSGLEKMIVNVYRVCISFGIDLLKNQKHAENNN